MFAGNDNVAVYKQKVHSTARARPLCPARYTRNAVQSSHDRTHLNDFYEPCRKPMAMCRPSVSRPFDRLD